MTVFARDWTEWGSPEAIAHARKVLGRIASFPASSTGSDQP